jgi:ABC-type multidrug transport system fused ATPase/permease subunit
LRDLGTQRHAAMESRTAGERIAALLALKPPRRFHGPWVTLPEGPLTVSLSGVGYTYPNGAQALDDVSLTLSSGARTALVGRTGAGKSTLVNLLLGYMEPSLGSIVVNDRRLDEIAPDAWRTLVALVPQRPYLFGGTVRDNIRLARPGASDEDVAAAAELAGAGVFIGELPLGYDTPIGERGARLSGGQAQRIALARAFLKDAPLLILDEPTAHLDAESEALIRQALDRLVLGRTVLTVAHRLSTVHTADQIAVLAAGRLVETGRHASLLAREGHYYDLVYGVRERTA